MPLNILIVGCSIAGPTLATFLLLSPLSAVEKPHITIVERARAVRKEGQNVDIRQAGATIIRKLGLEKVIRAATTGEEGVQWVDDDNGVWGSFAAAKSDKFHSPTSDIEILRGSLAHIMFERSKTISEEVKGQGGFGIEYIFGDYLSSIEEDGQKVNVVFKKSGEKRAYDIVVGADGLQSSTRRMVWGIDGEEERVKRLGMYSGYFSMPKGKTDNQWRRWWHAPGRRGIMLRPDDQNGRTTCFMSVVNEKDQRLVDAAVNGREDVANQKALIQEYFQGSGWECDRILPAMMASSDFYYDMVAQVKMEHWSKGRVALLGDSAYCASPLSGMGTTLALNGAYILAGNLLRYPNDYTTAFAEYEQKMLPLVERAQKLVPGAPHILHPETAWGVWITNAVGYLITLSRVSSILFMFFGPSVGVVPVEDYGFRELSELTE